MKRFKRIALVVLAVIFVVFFWLFNKWASSPLSVNQAHTHSNSAAPATLPKYKNIELSSFSTRLPNSLKTRIVQDPQTSYLVSLVAFGAGTSSEQIAITSNRLPPEGLGGIADYNYRQSNTTEYVTLQHQKLAELGGIAFQKLQKPTEIAYFIAHGERYASIVVSGTASTDKARSLADDILLNWQWK